MEIFGPRSFSNDLGYWLHGVYLSQRRYPNKLYSIVIVVFNAHLLKSVNRHRLECHNQGHFGVCKLPSPGCPLFWFDSVISTVFVLMNELHAWYTACGLGSFDMISKYTVQHTVERFWYKSETYGRGT